jgi:hypothetical protein
LTLLELWIVDGRANFNNRGISCPPRNLVQEFLIIASPGVFGGEILGSDNDPFQGLPWCLTILLAKGGHLKPALDGEEKLTFSAAAISFSAWIKSSNWIPLRAAAAMNSSFVGVFITSSSSSSSERSPESAESRIVIEL